MFFRFFKQVYNLEVVLSRGFKYCLLANFYYDSLRKKLKLTDITGYKVAKVNPTKRLVVFHLKDLSNGVYIIDFATENGSIQKKLVIANR